MRHSCACSMVVAVLGLLASAIAAGCSSEADDASQPQPSDGGTSDATPDGLAPDAGGEDALAPEAGALSWKACAGGFSGACTSFSAPLDYGVPTGAAIDIYVNLIASAPNSRAQLWLLQGGPGGSGADMVSLGQAIAPELPDVDIYTLDHRGVNRSARLACSEPVVWPQPQTDAGANPAERYAAAWQPCLDELESKWGEGLRQFTTSNASRDLARAIELTRRPGQEVYIYGVSYGTYWAQRYLQMYPDQPAAVVLDSIVSMAPQYLSDWDTTTNLGVAHWVTACQNDSVCRSKLGDDPMARLTSIAALAQSGHCAALDSSTRTQLNRLFQSNLTAPYALAAMYRYERCTAQDVAAIQQLVTTGAQVLAMGSTFSEALFYEVTFSELWEAPAPAYDELLSRAAKTLFPTDVALEASLRQSWPVFPLDSYARQFPKTSLPMLLMNGTLDIQTPVDLAEKIAPQYGAEHQHFVVLQGGNHGSIVQSTTNTGEPCGLQIIASFLKNPQGQPDTSCVDRILPPDFEGNATTTLFLMGVPDMWESVEDNSPMPPSVPPDPRLQSELERLRRGNGRL